MTRIYLDHAATSPLRPEARLAMEEGFAIWANPSSPHAEGRKARAALEDARARVKAALGWDGEVIFTSGASEAALLAFDRAVVIHEAVSAVEHDAIRQFVGQRGVPEIAVQADGSIDLAALAANISPSGLVSGIENRTLVAIQHVNSETGNQQDISRVAEVVHAGDGLLLVDCAQSAGKLPVPEGADMAIVAAHKFGGPVGVGALLVRDYAMLTASGGHERGYRRGTENLPGVLGMTAALEVAGTPYCGWDTASAIARLVDRVREAGGEWLGDRLAAPNAFIHAIAMPGISAASQVMRFDMAGFAVSQGSACSSGAMKTSAVLAAMGVDPDVAARVIRLSLGWCSTEAEVDAFAEAWAAMAKASK